MKKPENGVYVAKVTDDTVKTFHADENAVADAQTEKMFTNRDKAREDQKRDAAAKLRSKEISICRDDIELEEGVVFIADLVGLPVLADGVEIGKITEVLTPPGNDVYVVKGEHEYMIPAVKEFVEELNPDAGYVKVRLIEGMRTDAD